MTAWHRFLAGEIWLCHPEQQCWGNANWRERGPEVHSGDERDDCRILCFSSSFFSVSSSCIQLLLSLLFSSLKVWHLYTSIYLPWTVSYESTIKADRVHVHWTRDTWIHPSQGTSWWDGGQPLVKNCRVPFYERLAGHPPPSIIGLRPATDPSRVLLVSKQALLRIPTVKHPTYLAKSIQNTARW